MSDFMQREMKKTGFEGVHHSTAFVLLPLLNKEGLTLSDLARVLHMKPPTITVIANRLENMGLIRRERGKKDRRQVQLFLTKSGKKTANAIDSVCRKLIQTMVAGLNSESISQTGSTINRITENVDGALK